MENLSQHIEAIIFTSEQPVTETLVCDALNKIYGFDITEEEVKELIQEIGERYTSEQYAIELKRAGGGWQFLTKSDFHPTVAGFLQHKSKKKLSNSALETLAIIAYKQPIAKSEMEQIRGVNCDYSVTKLLEKELVEIAGRSEGPGKPLLYKTSQMFMDYFGINSIEDLPKLKELQPQDNSIGNPEDSPEELPETPPEASTEVPPEAPTEDNPEE